MGFSYAEHAKELGDAVPDKPVLFLKPFSIAVEAQSNGDTLEVSLPKGPYRSHYEAEIILKLGRGKTVEAVSLGLDLTLRDLQVHPILTLTLTSCDNNSRGTFDFFQMSHIS
jgi:2-keto-4-pentenoate hydratase/2-oxohepta-3-ene-1,7-dioic acid hydratase in catechol pathway